MRWRHTLFKNRSALSSKKFFNLQRLLRIEMLQIPCSNVCCKHSSNSKGPYLIFFKLDVFVWIANCMSHYVEIAKIRKGYFPYFRYRSNRTRPKTLPSSWMRLQMLRLPQGYPKFNLSLPWVYPCGYPSLLTVYPRYTLSYFWFILNLPRAYPEFTLRSPRAHLSFILCFTLNLPLVYFYLLLVRSA